MKLYRILSVLLCLIFIFTGLALGKVVKEITGGINRNQPISLGIVIYHRLFSKSDLVEDRVVYTIIQQAYTYIANHGCCIEIKYTHHSDDSLVGESQYSTILRLFLDTNKQALLKIKKLQKDEPEKELIITVVDEFDRITVKELK